MSITIKIINLFLIRLLPLAINQYLCTQSEGGDRNVRKVFVFINTPIFSYLCQENDVTICVMIMVKGKSLDYWTTLRKCPISLQKAWKWNTVDVHAYESYHSKLTNTIYSHWAHVKWDYNYPLLLYNKKRQFKYLFFHITHFTVSFLLSMAFA